MAGAAEGKRGASWSCVQTQLLTKLAALGKEPKLVSASFFTWKS